MKNSKQFGYYYHQIFSWKVLLVNLVKECLADFPKVLARTVSKVSQHIYSPRLFCVRHFRQWLDNALINSILWIITVHVSISYLKKTYYPVNKDFHCISDAGNSNPTRNAGQSLHYSMKIRVMVWYSKIYGWWGFDKTGIRNAVKSFDPSSIKHNIFALLIGKSHAHSMGLELMTAPSTLFLWGRNCNMSRTSMISKQNPLGYFIRCNSKTLKSINGGNLFAYLIE